MTIFYAMTEKNLLKLGFFGVLLGCFISFSACGSDSSSSSDNSSADESSGSAEGGSSSSGDTTGSSASAGTDDGTPAKTETVSSKEVLTDPKNVVNGTCGPSTSKISKGEIATWKFYRGEGEGSVFDQILAPFVWTTKGGKTESLQGNGMDTINVRYLTPGTYTATLKVDGNSVTCEPLQVQGIPIVIKSCGVNAATVKAGQTISWTVDASSESEITGYSWTSTFGTVSGSGKSGSILAASGMHKKSVTATVTVTNKDNTSESYLCEGATVLDPEAVDLVLTVGDINGDDTYREPNRTSLPDDMFIPAGTPMVVQIPQTAKTNCAITCAPRVGADHNSTVVTWDGSEVSNFSYITPTGCAPGKKYTVESNNTLLCLVGP